VERSVTLDRPFYLATKEVSNNQFRRWKNQHSSSAIKGMSLDMAVQPVVKVSWEDAALFCNWLSGKDGLSPFYRVENGSFIGIDWQSNGYRLPTEAEWAWGAKVDSQGLVTQFPWENSLYPPMKTIDNYADSSAKYLLPFTITQYSDGHAVSAPVGSFEPNSKGLYNMGGNVSEWTNDYYDIKIHRGAAIVDPKGPQSGNRHVIRGASWALGSRSELRLSFRDAGYEGRLDVGFRIARYVDNPGVLP
jgi:formylglycine-generating enzyme required for sulfatase activity